MQFREAREDDLPTLIALLADDALGSQRETISTADQQSYQQAFAAIDQDPNHQLLLAVDEDEILGMLQLSFLPNLTYQGGWRAQVEGVRVARSQRGRGLGRQLLEEALRRSAERRCVLVQLTTDKRRPEAVRFYETLGFHSSHEGMKYWLTTAP